MSNPNRAQKPHERQHCRDQRKYHPYPKPSLDKEVATILANLHTAPGDCSRRVDNTQLLEEKALRKSIAELQKINTLQSQKIAQFENTAKTSNLNITTLKSMCNGLNIDNTYLTTQNARLRGQILGLESDIEDLKAKIAKSQQVQLLVRLQEANKQFAKNEATYKGQIKWLQTLSSQIKCIAERNLSQKWSREVTVQNLYNICLDVDGTLGNFGGGSLFYQFWLKTKCKTISKEQLRNMFVKHYLNKGAARPYLKELLTKLYAWKCNKKIRSLALYTSGSNEDNYYSFLQMCLAQFAGVPTDLFGPICSKEKAGQGNILADGSTVKCLGPRDIIVDDRPEKLIGGNGLVVSCYKFEADTSDFVKAWTCKHCAKSLRECMDKDRKAHVPNNISQCDDTALKEVIERFENDVIRPN